MIAIRRYRLHLIFGLIYVVLSAYSMLYFLHGSNLGDVFYRTQFEATYEGTAWKPFVYRVLIPKATWLIVETTPASWQESINRALYDIKFNPAFSGIRNSLPWLADVYPDPQRIYPRAVMTLLIYGCLWGYIWAIYRLAQAAFPDNRAIHFFAPIFGMLVIPSFSWPFCYVYDIPVLFLSTACYYCIITGKIKPYVVFFTLATLNKESALFIALLFSVWFFRRMNSRQYAMAIATQCVIYVTIKIVLTMSFIPNPGWFLERHVADVLTNDLFSRSGYQRILVIAGLWFLLTFRWQDKPLFLKQLFWMMPIFYLCYILFGMPGEYRAFFDILPLAVLLGTHTLVAATGIADSPSFNPMEKKPHAPMD